MPKSLLIDYLIADRYLRFMFDNEIMGQEDFKKYEKIVLEKYTDLYNRLHPKDTEKK